jgi:hypothetical protein
MGNWEVKKGKTSVQEIPICDRKGVLLQNLIAATAIKFQVKEKKSDATPKISKTVGNGIAVDVPSKGYLRIDLTPTDTNLQLGDYFMALQIEWSKDEIYEIVLEIENEETEIFRIIEAMIH